MSSRFRPRDLSRRIEAADIQRYVLDYLSQNYPGCRLTQDPEDKSVVSIELVSAAKNDLSAYLRQRRSPAITVLIRNDPSPVRCRFAVSCGGVGKLPAIPFCMRGIKTPSRNSSYLFFASKTATIVQPPGGARLTNSGRGTADER